MREKFTNKVVDVLEPQPEETGMFDSLWACLLNDYIDEEYNTNYSKKQLSRSRKDRSTSRSRRQKDNSKMKKVKEGRDVEERDEGFFFNQLREEAPEECTNVESSSQNEKSPDKLNEEDYGIIEEIPSGPSLSDAFVESSTNPCDDDTFNSKPDVPKAPDAPGTFMNSIKMESDSQKKTKETEKKRRSQKIENPTRADIDALSHFRSIQEYQKSVLESRRRAERKLALKRIRETKAKLVSKADP
jgi:hypothetical protein